LDWKRQVYMVRLFVAIDITNKKVVDTAIRVQDLIRRNNIKATFSNPNQLHITLKFLGEIQDTLIDEIKNALSKIHFNRFSIRFEGIDAFPSILRPRVIFIDVEHSRELETLYKAVDKSLSFLRIREDKRFHPHVTIARIKSIFGWNKSLVDELKSIDINSTEEIIEFKLKQSVLKHSGPEYIDLMSIPLG